MGASGLMLIPVTHPTQCVAECGMRVQRTSKHDLGSIHGVQWSIAQFNIGRPNFIGAYIRTKCVHEPESEPFM